MPPRDYVRPDFRDSIPVLYDIEADPGETNNLRRFNPDVVNQIEETDRPVQIERVTSRRYRGKPRALSAGC